MASTVATLKMTVMTDDSFLDLRGKEILVLYIL